MWYEQTKCKLRSGAKESKKNEEENVEWEATICMSYWKVTTYVFAYIKIAERLFYMLVCALLYIIYEYDVLIRFEHIL